MYIFSFLILGLTDKTRVENFGNLVIFFYSILFRSTSWLFIRYRVQ